MVHAKRRSVRSGAWRGEKKCRGGGLLPAAAALFCESRRRPVSGRLLRLKFHKKIRVNYNNLREQGFPALHANRQAFSK